MGPESYKCLSKGLQEMENQITLLKSCGGGGGGVGGGGGGRAGVVMCSYVFYNSIYKMFHAC